MTLSDELEAHEYAYVTTSGRVTGRPHRIEIWFVVVDGSVWVNSGGGHRADWVKNITRDPSITLEIGDQSWPARATPRTELSEHPARERLARRYQRWRPGEPLSDWARDSLLVEIVVSGEH